MRQNYTVELVMALGTTGRRSDDGPTVAAQHERKETCVEAETADPRGDSTTDQTATGEDYDESPAAEN